MFAFTAQVWNASQDGPLPGSGRLLGVERLEQRLLVWAAIGVPSGTKLRVRLRASLQGTPNVAGTARSSSSSTSNACAASLGMLASWSSHSGSDTPRTCPGSRLVAMIAEAAGDGRRATCSYRREESLYRLRSASENRRKEFSGPGHGWHVEELDDRPQRRVHVKEVSDERSRDSISARNSIGVRTSAFFEVRTTTSDRPEQVAGTPAGRGSGSRSGSVRATASQESSLRNARPGIAGLRERSAGSLLREERIDACDLVERQGALCRAPGRPGRRGAHRRGARTGRAGRPGRRGAATRSGWCIEERSSTLSASSGRPRVSPSRLALSCRASNVARVEGEGRVEIRQGPLRVGGSRARPRATKPSGSSG